MSCYNTCVPLNFSFSILRLVSLGQEENRNIRNAECCSKSYWYWQDQLSMITVLLWCRFGYNPLQYRQQCILSISCQKGNFHEHWYFNHQNQLPVSRVSEVPISVYFAKSMLEKFNFIAEHKLFICENNTENNQTIQMSSIV